MGWVDTALLLLGLLLSRLSEFPQEAAESRLQLRDGGGRSAGPSLGAGSC